ncbi:hypothetical protein [Leucobacter sp. cx-169]|uniref:hypothetical protein n=1 Tax=Leucobacter sp. cx-169 TaxID=2770549 RepID=UPI00165D6E6E|nr:hypothetical protein [Leucobacter sp. cx-169]MBC9927295.1 hypothetical protein [Leucobacter sp. cx-169]
MTESKKKAKPERWRGGRKDGYCPQASSSGLSEKLVELIGTGILTECARADLHTGKHRNAAGDMQWWGGKLDSREQGLVEALRAGAPASGTRTSHHG